MSRASRQNSAVRTVDAGLAYAPKNLITVDQVFAAASAAGKPVIIPHRGAGSQVAPENTLEAFRLGMSYGFGIIDGGDLWPLAGTTQDLAVNHNSTVDYMTTGTGNISDFLAVTYRNLPVDAGGSAGWFGGTWGMDATVTGGYRPLRSVTQDDLMREFGGKIVLCPEVKGSVGTPYLLAQINRYGFAKSMLVQHFSIGQLPQFVAAGCPCMWLSTDGTGSTMAAVAAAGVKYVAFDSASVSDATVSAWVADGRFVVGVYTIDRQWQRDKYDALGCKFYFSDSPLWLTKDPTIYGSTTRDLFASGDYPHGHLGNLAASVGMGNRGYFQSGGYLTIPSVGGGAVDASVERNILLGYIKPPTSSFTFDVDVRWDTIPTDTTSYASVTVSPTDKAFFRTAAADVGLTFCLRANGSLFIRDYDASGTAGASSLKATGAITVAGTVTHLKGVIGASTVTLQRTDAGSTDTTALSWTHGGTRGQNLHVGRTDSAGGTGVVSFKNLITT